MDRYHVLVDESGDRGWGANSSPVFVLGAVIVREIDEPKLHDMMDEINVALGQPPGKMLHWKDNISRHPERKYVAGQLALLPADFIVIVLDKKTARAAMGMQDTHWIYRDMVRRLLERVSWLMKRKRGVASRVLLSHVRGMRVDAMESYIDLLRTVSDQRIEWERFSQRYPAFEQPSTYRSLQVPDLVTGSVYAALCPDRFGQYESTYLETIAPRLWIGPTQRLNVYGLNFVGTNGCFRSYPWWDAVEQQSRQP